MFGKVCLEKVCLEGMFGKNSSMNLLNMNESGTEFIIFFLRDDERLND